MNRIKQVQAVTNKIASTHKRRKYANSTTGPPTYKDQDDRHYRLSRLLSLLTLTLLLLFSIPALILKAYSYNFIESNAEMGFYLVVDDDQGVSDEKSLVAALPHNLIRVPEKLVLVVAVLNILLSIAHLTFVAWDWKSGKRTQTRAFRRNAMILHTINAALVLTALIAMSASHKASSQFQNELIPRTPNAISPSGYKYYRYDAGAFDLETWTCSLENVKSVGEARKDYSAQCGIEVAGRTVMVPFFIVALAVACLSIWVLVVGGKQEPRGRHLWTKDIDLEINKGTTDSRHVEIEEVELTTLERPEKQKDNRLSKIEEDEQEADEALKQVTGATETVIGGKAESLTIGGKDTTAKKIDEAL